LSGGQIKEPEPITGGRGNGGIRKNGTQKSGARIVRILVAIVLTAGLVIFLVNVASPEKLWSVITGVELLPLLAAFAVYMSNNLVRAGRFTAAGAQSTFGALFAVASVHALLVRILPLRSGDLSYAPLLRSVGGGELKTGFAGLIIMRLMDLCVVLLAGFAFLAGGLLPGVRPESQGLILMAVSAAGVVGLYFYLERIGRAGIAVVRFITRNSGIKNFSRLNEKLDAAAEELFRIRNAPSREKAVLFLLTVLYWIHIGFLYFFALWALGLRLTVSGALAVAVFGVAGSMIPLSAIGTFGFQEAGFTVGLVIAGCGQSEAAALGISTSLIVLLSSIMPAIPCAAWIWLRRKN